MENTVGFATLSIAIIVALISGQQAWTNKLRLRHELFERRFQIFKTAQAYISKIMEKGNLNDEMLAELYPQFLDAWQRSRFLFGDDIANYLDEIRDRSLKCGRSSSQGEHKEANDHLGWLCEQSPEIFNKFQPYMRFKVK